MLAPTPKRLFFTLLVLSLVVFLRPPTTNFVFDEQEALLANPYLLGDLPWYRVFHVDFWGLPPERSIGSYRPLPNLLWRPLAFSLGFHSPWLLTLINLVVHALAGTFFACAVKNTCPSLSPRDSQVLTWISGLLFALCALSTEAVSSAVGLADVLVGCLSAAGFFLLTRLPAIVPGRALLKGATWLPISGVFCVALLGLLSKESMIASLLLFPLVSWFRPVRQGIWGRVSLSFLVGVAGALALLSYVGIRNHSFGEAEPRALKIVMEGPFQKLLGSFLSWLSPPALPSDAMNNPLLLVDSGEGMLTAASVFAEQLGLFLLPVHLSADYSFPRQLTAGFSPTAVVGILVFLGLGTWCALGAWRLAKGEILSPARSLSALGAGWVILSYLPVSNTLVLLPTIRAERLFYTPALGGCMILAALFLALDRLSLGRRIQALTFFLVFSLVQARAHALHYSSDLVFWRATSAGAPASAKSYLNYGVMVGARGDHSRRLQYTRLAVKLAPAWPMGQIYLGDSYCRGNKPELAFEHYMRGLELGPNKKSLTALSLQCMWEEQIFSAHKHEILDLATAHRGTWLEYFVHDLSEQSDEGVGIPDQYRPRRYNERREGGVSR